MFNNCAIEFNFVKNLDAYKIVKTGNTYVIVGNQLSDELSLKNNTFSNLRAKMVLSHFYPIFIPKWIFLL